MVRLGARSGYEIKRTVERSIRFFWTISQAQIYPSLERLERAGLVHGHAEPQGKRPRRLFEITDAGAAALREWLEQVEPMPFELRDVGMLKLFFADPHDQDGALALLAAVRRRSEERVSTLRTIEPDADRAEQGGSAYPLLTLQMGIAFHQAMIDTCTEFERKLIASPAGVST
jgi:DNA-binding PadR family transcriptional regulator